MAMSIGMVSTMASRSNRPANLGMQPTAAYDAYRDREAKIRIISARKAMPQERALYNEKARS